MIALLVIEQREFRQIELFAKGFVCSKLNGRVQSAKSR